MTDGKKKKKKKSQGLMNQAAPQRWDLTGVNASRKFHHERLRG